MALQSGDEELLAMCTPATGHGTDNGAPPSHSQDDDGCNPLQDLAGLLGNGNPFHFDMTNSVMTLNNSELQVGPKFIATPTVTGFLDMPHIRVDDPSSEGVDVSPLPPSSPALPPTLLIKITPPAGGTNTPDVTLTRDSVPTPECPTPTPHPPRGRVAQPQHSPRQLTKTVSTPVKSSPGCGSPPSPAPLTPQPPPSSPQPTYVNSDVQYGTKIVINYKDCGKKSCAGGCSDGSCSGTDGGAGTPPLQEFKDILQRRYKQRSRSPLLPWHLGRTIAPLEHYYLEPRISSVDRRGNPSTDTVSLIQLLTGAGNETRFLVEGDAGMGKTLLAAHLAQDWAEGLKLAQFGLVLLVSLGDFQGSIEHYIQHDILPSYFDADKFRLVWDYWKEHAGDILFILDGYDELGKFDRCELQNLITGQDFPNSRVLVTSRPTTLQCFATRLVVKGFDEQQMWKFIAKYFDVVEDTNCGASLQHILVRHNKYRKLAERPLFCVLLCMLYETDGAKKELPDRMSDMLYKIMLCLIKWRKTRNRDTNEEMDGFPAEYAEAFDHFGQVCVNAIKNDRHRFSDEDVRNVPHFEEICDLGFLYNEDESDVLRIQVQKFWKPVHQTFIEYFAALHIANHIKHCTWGCRKCWKLSSLLERKDSEVLVFTAGVLGEHAYRLFDFTRFSKLQKLPEMQLLNLLREAGPHQHNKRVVASLLDHEHVIISTNEAYLEGWTYLLPQTFYRLKSLELVWRIKSTNPDQESTFVEASRNQLSAFFTALHKNTSVQTLKLRAKQDGAVFTEDKLNDFFSHIHKAFLKKGLKNLEFRDMKIDLGKHLRESFVNVTKFLDETAVNVAFPTRPAFSELRTLKLHTILNNEDLRVVCDTLCSNAPLLETLHLDGLELGHEGFTSLAKLIRTRTSLHHLYLSMNKALLVNVFGSNGNTDVRDVGDKGCIKNTAKRATSDFPPAAMSYRETKLRRNAAQKSHDEFTQHEHDNDTEHEVESQVDDVKLNDSQHKTVNDALVAAEHEDRSTEDTVAGDKKQEGTNNITSDSTIKLGREEIRNTQTRKAAANYSHDSSSDDEVSTPCKGGYTSDPNTALHHPYTELPFLFDTTKDISPKVPFSRHYWFIKGADTRLPLPLCVPSEHKSVFHYLFTALPASQLQTLSLDQPGLYLTIADLVCLGDALRTAPKLATLDLQRLRKIKSYMPILVSLAQSPSLETVNLSSDTVTVKDAALQLACRALQHNTKLKKLSLANWRFVIQDKVECLSHVRSMLMAWQVLDLNLRHCSLEFSDVNATMQQLYFSPPIATTNTTANVISSLHSINTLCLSECEVLEAGPRRGYMLLPSLASFASLQSLDVSGSLYRPSLLDDASCLQCFKHLSQLPLLRDITMNHWQFSLSETMSSQLSMALRQCHNLRDIKLHNVDEQRPRNDALASCSTSLLHIFVTSLSRLQSLSVCFYRINGRNMDEEMATWLTNCLNQHWRQYSIKLQVFGVSPEVTATLKAGLSKGLTHLKEKDSPPRVLTLSLRRPIFPSCCSLRFKKISSVAAPS